MVNETTAISNGMFLRFFKFDEESWNKPAEVVAGQVLELLKDYECTANVVFFVMMEQHSWPLVQMEYKPKLKKKKHQELFSFNVIHTL